MRSLTGLHRAAFAGLIAPFTVGCPQEAEARFSPPRPGQRRAGAGRKGVLASAEQKRLFLLYYRKAPLRRAWGHVWPAALPSVCTPPPLGQGPGTDAAHAGCAAGPRHRRARAEAAGLGGGARLAARRGRTPPPPAPDPGHPVLAEVPVLLLDATQRPHRRAQAAVDRPADYAGKKKAPA